MSEVRIVAVIPHYNHARTVGLVARAMLAQGLPVCVVDDGSDAASCAALRELSENEGVQVVWRAQNGGKGAAMKDGFQAARAAGYSHVLQIDADAQHCLDDAVRLVQAAVRCPSAVVCADPVYGDDAPKSRLYGRRITDFWTWVNTGTHAIHDAMCGFRVYPLAAVMPVLAAEKLGERMEFDIEILVHLVWRRVPLHWVATPVRYDAGGVSHFHMWRDNWLIARMHARLFCRMVRKKWLKTG